jgi:hypothetical protein
MVGGTNSNAILRHIARKANPALLGKDLKEQAQIDMLIDVMTDFRNGNVVSTCLLVMTVLLNVQ